MENGYAILEVIPGIWPLMAVNRAIMKITNNQHADNLQIVNLIVDPLVSMINVISSDANDRICMWRLPFCGVSRNFQASRKTSRHTYKHAFRYIIAK